jgi:OFA family oxalate/formate antiporter-like MFS transporter
MKTDPDTQAGPKAPSRRGVLVLAAATLINLPFGTVYAFSVFLKPMEALLGIGRAEMAIVFSAASICLTVGMLIGPALYRRWPPVPLLLACGALSAMGLVVAAAADHLTHLLIGYGVLFGLGGGVAFVMMQQALNQTIGTMSGLANGYVVSLYPMGAMLGAPIFGWAIQAFGLRATLAGLGGVILCAAVAGSVLWARAQVRMQDPDAAPADAEARHWGLFARLFAVFFLAASAGLMVMSQAAGILQAYGARSLFALGGTTFITGAIAAARIGGGWLVDRYSVPRVACVAHLIALSGSCLLLTWPGPEVAVLAMTLIGCGYGFISGLTAGAIARYWHRNAFGRVAGQMYIAWCIAAISLPVLAGWLYDRTQGYAGAMAVAAAVNLIGALMALSLPGTQDARAPSRAATGEH